MSDTPTTRLSRKEARALASQLQGPAVPIPALVELRRRYQDALDTGEIATRESCEDMALPAARESLMASRDAMYTLADLGRMSRS